MIIIEASVNFVIVTPPAPLLQLSVLQHFKSQDFTLPKAITGPHASVLFLQILVLLQDPTYAF